MQAPFILNVIDNIEKASNLINNQLNMTINSSPNVTVSTLTRLYSKWVAGQINIDQFPVLSNHDTFKQSVTSTKVIGNTASMETPLSLLESYVGLPATSIVVQTAPNIREVKMSLVLTKRVTLDPPLGSLIHSNPLQLTIFDTSVCLSTGCSFTVLLHTIDNQTYFNGQSTAGVIYRHCNVGDNTTSINLCANGYAVMTSCDGLSKYDIKTLCPYRVSQPGCGRLSSLTSTAINDICTMISYSGSITYCNCTIPASRYTLAKSTSVQIGTIVVSSIVTPMKEPTISPTSAPTNEKVLTTRKNSITTANTIILSVLLSVGICCFCGSILFFICRKRREKPIFKKWTTRADPRQAKFSNGVKYDEFYPVIPLNANVEDQSMEPIADVDKEERSLIMKSFSATYPLPPLPGINAGIYSEEARSPEREGGVASSEEDRSIGSDRSAFDEIPSPSCINICEIMNGPMTRPKPYFDIGKISNGSPSSRLGGSPPRSRAQPFINIPSSSSSPRSNFGSTAPSTRFPSPRGPLISPSRYLQRDVTKTNFNPLDTEDIFLGNLSVVEDEQTVDLSVLSGLRGSLKPYSRVNSSTRQTDIDFGQIEFEKNISFDNDNDSEGDNDNDNDNDNDGDGSSDGESLPVSLGEIYVSALNPFGEEWSGTSPAVMSLPTEEEEENEQQSRPISLGGIYMNALNPLGEQWLGMPPDISSYPTEEDRINEMETDLVSSGTNDLNSLGDQWLGGPGPVYIDNAPLRFVDSSMKNIWESNVASSQSSSETLTILDNLENVSGSASDHGATRLLLADSLASDYHDMEEEVDEVWQEVSSPPRLGFEIEGFLDLPLCEGLHDSEISMVGYIDTDVSLQIEDITDIDIDIDVDIDMVGDEDLDAYDEVEVEVDTIEVTDGLRPADTISK